MYRLPLPPPSPRCLPAPNRHSSIFMKNDNVHFTLNIKTQGFLSPTESMSYETWQGSNNRLGVLRVLNIIIFKRHVEEPLKVAITY